MLTGYRVFGGWVRGWQHAQLQVQLQMEARVRVREAGEYVDRVGGYGMRESVCAGARSGRPNLSASDHS